MMGKPIVEAGKDRGRSLLPYGQSGEGAATAAGAAAADAFSAALSRTYLEPPDLGLGAMADDARARADGYREAAGMLADAAGRPLVSWQALKDAVIGTGTEAETALGASFAIATGGVLTLFIAAPPNGSSVWVRVVDEVSGAAFEQEITADLPATTQFLSPRLFLNTGATAAAVAYDCAGVYLETDY